MAKQWAIKFTVQPIKKIPNRFPIDMLCYDQCYPSIDNESVSRINDTMSDYISASEFKSEPITLVHLSHGDKNWNPTNGRWQSFGYKVTNIRPAREY